MKPLTSIADLVNGLEKGYSNPKALNIMIKEEWISYSTAQVIEEVRYATLGLISIGMKRGDRLGILAFPSPRWVIMDLAIMIGGGVSVPLFANISDDNFLFEVMQTEMDTLIISGSEQWDVFARHKDHFTKIISFEEEGHDIGITYQALLQKGRDLDKQAPGMYEELKSKVDPDGLATIIYSSGSTGVPKGVMISHRSLVSLYHLENFRWDPPTDSYLSILPLAHVFGRCFNLFMVSWGVSVYYLNDIKNVAAICRDLHPTILVFVPRLLEKIYSKMLAKVQHAGGMKRALGLWAFELANMEEDSLYKTLLHPLADKVVYSALRSALGGKVRVVISGGAPLNPHLCHFFIDIGVPIYEGWGLTEASTATVNDTKNRKIGSVGKPLGDTVIKTSPEGELLVHGTLVMQGYYKNPEATAKALDSDGWLHTGDKGYIDEDGFVFIQGRMKEMYKTSTGEYIAPVPIEQALCKAALIDMALVVGDNRKFASCLLFPDHEVLQSLRAAHNADSEPYETFLKGDFVKQEMQNLINNINQHLNHWEQLHAYRFVLSPLTVESGELTPSMKIRREIVTKKFSHLIDEMYPEEKHG